MKMFALGGLLQSLIQNGSQSSNQVLTGFCGILRFTSSRGMIVEFCDVETTPLGELDAMMAKCKAVIVGCPTINQNILLPIYKLFAVINPIRDKKKLAGGFGSYGWSGGAQKDFDELSNNMKWDILEPVVFRGYPTSEQQKKGEDLAAELARQVKTIPPKIKDEDY